MLLLVLCQSCYSNQDRAVRLLSENHELKVRLAALGQDTSEMYTKALMAESARLLSDTSASEKESLAGGTGAAPTSATGAWIVRYYRDKFGEATKEGYITMLPLDGKFSNSATQDSPLRVSLLLDENKDFNIQLYEYASDNPVKTSSSESYVVTVKDKDSKVLDLWGSSYSDRITIDKPGSKRLHNALLKGGKLQFHLREAGTSTSVYQFTLDNADGFLAARKELRGAK